jgi:peptidoglycan/LPS O-acetylase OafA/YrhL
MPLGGAGVSFFFVLSGFILTYVYGTRIEAAQASGDSTRFEYGKFYLRRFARIWPLHIATMLIALFFVLGSEGFFRRDYPIEKIAANCFLLQGWIPNYDWIFSLNGPAWSLSVEAFFYLVFPFLLLGNTKSFTVKLGGIALMTVGLLLLVERFVPADHPWISFKAFAQTNPLFRLLEFSIGVTTGRWFLNQNRQRESGDLRQRNFIVDSAAELGAVALIVGFYFFAGKFGLFQTKSQFGIPPTLWFWFRFCGAAPVFAIVILTFARTRGILSRFAGNPAIVYLGEISYSFYMIHMGVMLILARQDWFEGTPVMIGVVITSFVLSIIFAAVLYQTIELPFRRTIVTSIERGGFWKSVGQEFKSLFLKSKPIWIVPSIMLLAGSGLFIHLARFNPEDSGRISVIASVTSDEIRDAKFEEDAILKGCRTTENSDGSLILDMAWELFEGRRSERFIKLLGHDGKVVGRGDPNRKLFRNFTHNATVIDRVTIPAAKMEGVTKIGIGFYDPERKTATVDRGPRPRGNRQLFVWQKE